MEPNSGAAQPMGEEAGIYVDQLPIRLWVKLAPLDNSSRVIRAVFLYAEHILKARKQSSVPELQVCTVSNLQGSEKNTSGIRASST